MQFADILRRRKADFGFENFGELLRVRIAASIGKGYGTRLSEWAMVVLKREGMETAYLTTDEWRVPVIKTYLATGFEPDLSTEDFKERWAQVYKQPGR